LFKLNSFDLLISLLLAGSMWFYVDHILVPHQKQYATEHQIPRGNLSDLYPRWLGSRELLLNGRDPYSPQVTREIQAEYYGRPLDAARPDDPKDEERFAYPVYVAFVLAPTVKLPFPVVRAIFSILLALLTILSIPLWLRILGWRCPLASTAILVVLTLGSFGAVQGIKLQQLTLLVSALIAAGTTALVSGHLIIAGLLIALSTIKPQLALPLTGWLILWTTGNFHERWKFLAGLLISIAVLLAASQYLLPGWIARFADAIVQYRRYTGDAGSVLDVLLSPAVGRLLACLLMILVAAISWRMRHASAKSDDFRGTTALVLAVTVVIVPMTAPYNQLLLLLAILLIIRAASKLWHASRLTRAMLVTGAVILFEPFLAAFALTVLSFMVPTPRLLELWAVPLYTSLAIPIAIFSLLLIILYSENFFGRESRPAAHSA
jgi:hypothetical protein